MSREALLARTLVELADTLVDDFDVVELLTLLTDRCVDVLDVGAAGLMLVAPDGELRVMASSSEAMRLLELFELQAQEGPCLDCYRTGAPSSTRTSPRPTAAGPGSRAEALAAGFRSVHAVPDAPARRRHRRPQPVPHRGRARCDQSTSTPRKRSPTSPRSPSSSTAPRSRRRSSTSNSTRALNSRIVIEQAKGVVAERLGLDMAQAFSTLRNHARNHNLRLADVAHDVIDGTLTATALNRAGPFGP